ncbi:MAG TPA: ribonuclease H-like domain-containing protein [Thermoplasmata archaeon]|nr:ribonuclease H-like domain-containing protein [Thermoplasmata archaeon]
MLRETFVHIPGVGYRTEERLWRSGIRTWDDFASEPRPSRLAERRASRIGEELARSVDALRRGRHRYFARTLPPREHWRAWSEFRDAVAFLDIETTGLSLGRDAVTVVGVYDGRRRRTFVQADNLDELPGALERAKLLVTFNGRGFDAPFLRKAFPRMPLDQIHLDLLHPLRRLGFSGGLKAIEREMGILRSEETSGLGGFDAVRLWRAYEAGDDDALELLIRYNMEDVVNLEPLASFAYDALRTLCLDRGFVTADRLPAPPGARPGGSSRVRASLERRRMVVVPEGA